MRLGQAMKAAVFLRSSALLLWLTSTVLSRSACLVLAMLKGLLQSVRQAPEMPAQKVKPGGMRVVASACQLMHKVLRCCDISKILSSRSAPAV